MIQTGAVRYKADDLRPRARDPQAPDKARAILTSLGGSSNVRQAEACSETMFWAAVESTEKLDEEALEQAGVQGIMRLEEDVVHLLVGLNADQYAAEMRAAMAS